MSRFIEMGTKSADFAQQPRIRQDFVLEKTSGSIATANRLITPAFIFIVAAERNIATAIKIIAFAFTFIVVAERNIVTAIKIIVFAFIFIVVAERNIVTAFVFIAHALIFIAIAFIFIAIQFIYPNGSDINIISTIGSAELLRQFAKTRVHSLPAHHYI